MMRIWLKSAVLLLLLLALPALGPSEQDRFTWAPLSSALMPRDEAPSAVINGKLYVFGGFINEDLEITNTVEVYDPTNDTWSARVPMLVPVTHAGATLVDQQVWLVAGFEGNHPGTVTDAVQIYDAVADSWSMGPPLPRKLASGMLVRLGRHLHHVGGLENRNDDVNDHFVLDLDNLDAGWTSAAPLPRARNHLGGAAFGGKLYAIGGQYRHDRNRQFVAFMHAYDPTTDTWTRLADLPDARSHFESSTFVHKGRIIIGGGVAGTPDAKPAVDHVTAYNPDTDTWSALEPLPETLLGPVLKVIGNTLILSHGGLERSYFAQDKAYYRPAPGGPGDRLGFWPNRIDLTIPAGGTAVHESLLWTVSQATNYTIDLSKAPAWLSQVIPASGTTDVAGREVAIHVQTSNLAPGTYTASLQATAAGYPATTLDIILTVTSASVLPFKEQDGQVVIEAEHFHSTTPRGDHEWKPDSLDGSIGTAMEVMPNTGANINANYTTASPELQYEVDFTTSGTYYVWARGWAADDTNDSWHVGLDGASTPSADRMVLTSYNDWAWVNTTMDEGMPATLEVAVPGKHIVNLWMREDGLRIDRLLLTQNPAFVPTGPGPPESTRSTPTSTDAQDTVPPSFRLEQNYPNPFNPVTTLRFTLSRPVTAQLNVYDITGRLVAQPIHQPMEAGTFEVSWDGRNAQGQIVPTGVYFARLEVGTFRQTRTMLLVK